MFDRLQTGSSNVRTLTSAAQCALREGDRTEARLLLEEALAKSPNDPDALTFMACLSEEDGRTEEGTSLFRRAVAADPTPERRLALASYLRRHGSPELAIEELEALPQAMRSQGHIALLYARVLGEVGKHAEELATYRQMLEQEPRNPRIWLCFAYALRTAGRSNQAARAARTAIELEPTFGGAYWALANFNSSDFTEEDLSRMRDMAAQTLPLEDSLHVHFALGKAYEDAKEFESSFRHYAAGNALRAKTLEASKVGITGKVDDVIEHCSRGMFERAAEAGCKAADPIFIVGLHRSGSTLVEQILASHPLIEGTGELKVMPSLARRVQGTSTRTFGETIAALAPSELASIGEEYLQRTRAFRRTDRPYFIDKLPGNWINIPLIRLALPRAKIIDARRHPMACGFSNFKQNYAAGVAHSYSLRWMGEFYYDYWRFMRHFREQQPGVVHRLINERLVENPEDETRKLLDYVGVPAAHTDAKFYETDRAVRTPSAEQVRRPLNREGFDRWRSYEPWLGELKLALGDSVECWDS